MKINKSFYWGTEYGCYLPAPLRCTFQDYVPTEICDGTAEGKRKGLQFPAISRQDPVKIESQALLHKLLDIWTVLMLLHKREV